jgi:flagellar biosynthesis/type III secretory pathway M-ring protein FliF/YscJ
MQYAVVEFKSMKIVKVVIAALVIIAALFFIYVTVARNNAKPIESSPTGEEERARAQLVETVQTMPTEVDPQRRANLESFVSGIADHK